MVIGLDNINNYYDVNLKYARLGELGIYKRGCRGFCRNNTQHNLTALTCNLQGFNLEDREERCQNYLRHLILTWYVT